MKYFALAHVYIILHCVCANSSTKNDGYIATGNIEQDITINQQPGNPYERFPDTFSIWLQYGDSSVRHELFRDDVITNTLSPVLFRLSSYLPNDLMTEQNTEHFAFYRNEEAGTSSLQTHFVLYRPNPDTAALFYGQIFIDDNKYKLYPDYTTINRYKILKEVKTDHTPTSSLLSKKTNVIELLVWLAPDLYEFHANRLNLSPTELDKWFQSFSRSLTREVDLIFSSISTVSLRVYFSNVGYDTSETTTKWYSDNHFGTMLDAEAILNDFSDYLSKRKQLGLIPHHDHVVILTRKSLAEFRSGTIKSKLAHGRPYSICSENNGQSISIASITTSSYIQTIVQSIGIGFGSKDDFYKVPTDILSTSDLGKDNPDFRCSSACEIKIARHIMTLKTNCLQTGIKDSEFRRFLETPRFTDPRYQSGRSQCETILGTRSKRCLQCRSGNCLNLRQASSSDDTFESGIEEGREVTVAPYMSSSLMTPSVQTTGSLAPSTMTSPINRLKGEGDNENDQFYMSTQVTRIRSTDIPSSTPIVSDNPYLITPEGRIADFSTGIISSSPDPRTLSTFVPSSNVPLIDYVTERTHAVDSRESISPDIIAACLCCQLCGCDGACSSCPEGIGTFGIPESLNSMNCDGDSPCCLRTDIDAG